MGISVPISTEHYRSLKEISDDLGLGLKRTVEFLVGYYKETSCLPGEKKSQVQLDTNSSIHEAHQGNINKKMQDQTSSKVSDSSIKSIMEMPSRKNIEYKIKTGNLVNPVIISGPEIQSQKLLDETSKAKKESLYVATKLLEQAYRSSQNCCYSCGFPKKSNAKFCFNCGTLLQVKS